MGAKLRVGIVGIDHWYAGFGYATQAQKDPRVELVAVAHRDEARAQEFASRFGIKHLSTDYRSVVQRDDIDLVAMACPTAEHAALAQLAASRGKHIIGIKPMAMNGSEGAAIVEAVRAAGVHYFPYESNYRINTAWKRYKAHFDEGRMGRPVSATVIVRATIPRSNWPGAAPGTTWWLDPKQVFGGGWVDHSIYFIDYLRWLWESEPVRISGEAANLVDPALQVEDFGVATIAFAGGPVASLEVTWTGGDGGYWSCQFVGTKGHLVTVDPLSGKTGSAGGVIAPDVKGWVLTPPYPAEANTISHMAGAILDGKPLAASVEDGYKNLKACLAFYEAASRHTVVDL